MELLCLSLIFNDKKYKNIHFIGIGGISMSGIAKLLLKKGYNISGSDRNTSKEIQILEQNGAKNIYRSKKGKY